MKSQIQKNVLMLYRSFLKFGAKNLMGDKKKEFDIILRKKFDINRNVSRMKINFIEFKLREGKNLLNQLVEKGITGIN